ncbi:splicing factor [Encephalitozoon romaleae SJ-2008]|uniref:Splicing factor n=1 Tax=Encephalitozoon romaleae (strain SJ-2008) TaxID=1178016 RepID=I6ZVG8_ENCRO|nr:splicing factor [Encephalitozoon romaleae SJ-2008]AFN83726.1 splicing factor [Encephalitozoon romaleae SJ-2008]
MRAVESRLDYEILVAPDNRTYYYNRRTRKSSFTKPDILKSSDEEFEVDPWIECRSKQGKTFYHNTITGESRWKRPLERKGEKALIRGIGIRMKITDKETSRYLLHRLLEQYSVENMKDAFYKLSTEPIFRAMEVNTREWLMRKYFEDKEKDAREEEARRQKYYVDEVCKIDVNVSDFFGFNNVFSKHPYYLKIEDKFGCYEVYVERHMGGTTARRLEKIFKGLGIDLHSSIEDVLKMKEVESFDRKAVLFSFIRYFRRLESEFLSNIKKKKMEIIQNICYHKEEFKRLLGKMYNEGLIYYKMKFKNAFHLFKDSEPFLNLLGSSESPKEIYFEFINDLENRLRRYEKEGAKEISPVDKRAMDKYFESIGEEKEEGEI